MVSCRRAAKAVTRIHAAGTVRRRSIMPRRLHLIHLGLHRTCPEVKLYSWSESSCCAKIASFHLLRQCRPVNGTRRDYLQAICPCCGPHNTGTCTAQHRLCHMGHLPCLLLMSSNSPLRDYCST